MERGLPISVNEKQNQLPVLHFVFIFKVWKNRKANSLASTLPHTRESREVIQPLISQGIDENEINKHIKNILLGDYKELW